MARAKGSSKTGDGNLYSAVWHIFLISIAILTKQSGRLLRYITQSINQKDLFNQFEISCISFRKRYAHSIVMQLIEKLLSLKFHKQ